MRSNPYCKVIPSGLAVPVIPAIRALRSRDYGIVDSIEWRTGSMTIWTSCSWHHDWNTVFLYLVLRGRGSIECSTVLDAPCEKNTYMHPPAQHTRQPYAVGDIIALHGMARHRATCRTCSVALHLNEHAAESHPRVTDSALQKRAKHCLARLLKFDPT